MSSNNLTQVISNITSTYHQMASSLNALPNPVAGQSAMLSSLQSSIPLLQSIQSQILYFTNNSSPILNNALNDINNGNYNDAISKIQSINNNANTLKSLLNNASSQLNLITPQIINVNNELNTLHVSLSSKLSSLNGQLQDAKNNVDYYNKRKWYFLLLGPLGIVGVATAAGLIISWTNKANDYQNDVNKLNNQISTVNSSSASVGKAQKECVNSINSVSILNNTVDVMFSDISEVLTDLSSPTPVTAKLYVTAAITELQLLETDAS